MPETLMHPNLPRQILLKDRLQRHGLYYATKLIEKDEAPKLVITSFWRSGSTLLLEFLADLFSMRPYFEPLTPREPKFAAIYKSLESLGCNTERLHPIDVDQQIQKQLLSCTFQSKWVYQCQTRQNFLGANGKIMKLVTGAHVVEKLQNQHGAVVHISRDVFKVAESFINSKWTNRFFEGVDLTYLATSSNLQVAAFYAKFAEFLVLRKFSLVEQVAIYHTLSEHYVRAFAPKAIFVNYEDFLRKPERLVFELSQILNVSFEASKINFLLKRPSRMTVHNVNKRELMDVEKGKIIEIIDRIQGISSIQY